MDGPSAFAAAFSSLLASRIIPAIYAAERRKRQCARRPKYW
jgi:hypothetical protein